MSNDQKETLRGLVALSNDLLNQLVELSGELSPELEAQLATLEISLPAKVDSYAYLMDRLEAEAGFWKARAESNALVMKACLAAQKRLKENLKFAMQEQKSDEIKGNDIRFKLQNSKPSLIIDEATIDPAYTFQHVETRIDKKKIEEDLKIGVPVKGAALEPSFSLRVYANRKAE